MTEWTEKQRKILGRVRTLRVATISPQGDPFSAPVPFYFDGGTLYFASPAESEQMANLRANRRVALLADTSEDGVLQGFVVQGLAQRVRSDRESQAVREAMAAKYTDSPGGEGEGTLIKIAPVRILDLGASPL
ncbi:MAG: pyridoxamine 5'-phosphate oxidase family protein [Thermoplasmata archaeon]